MIEVGHNPFCEMADALSDAAAQIDRVSAALAMMERADPCQEASIDLQIVLSLLAGESDPNIAAAINRYRKSASRLDDHLEKLRRRVMALQLEMIGPST